MKKRLFIGLMVLGICGWVFSDAFAAASKVYIDPATKRLTVQRSNSTMAQPYIIKGVTWSPATRAPATGKNPANPAQTVDYGFFFDATNRRPQGNAVLNYWQKSEFTANYMADIAKMKEMNINTVRVYSDFGVDPAVYQPILDELYNNGIMVIMTVAIAPEDLGIFEVYVGKDDNNNDLPSNNFYATGYMGAGLVLSKSITNPAAGNMCTRLIYTDSGAGWAGVYWQSKNDNWGTEASGYNLTGYDELRFKARGEVGGEQIKIVVGIQANTYPDSTHFEYGPITLTTNWQSYSIPLAGKDLSRINGGFGVVFEKAKGGSSQAAYLDQIYYYSSNLKKQYKNIVSIYKNHPAILMWSLGNEWNLNAYYGGENIDITLAADLTNLAAYDIKTLDPNHPISSCLGDRFAIIPNTCGTDPAGSDIPTIVRACSQVDIWGLNIYRGASFGSGSSNIFQQWAGVTPKPFYFSEFGTDSFISTSYQHPFGGCDARANGIIGAENQFAQSQHVIGLWNQIKPQLTVKSANNQCLGGLVHEFNDELWKVGNYHAGLGGLVGSGDHSYDDYNAEGFYIPGAHPDNLSNEEYYGMMNADRNPKMIYNDLKKYYQTLEIDFSAIGGKRVYVNNNLTFPVTATDLLGGSISLSASGLPYGASFTANQGTGSFIWTPNSSQITIHRVTFTATNSAGSISQDVDITVVKKPYTCFLKGTAILMADGSTKPIEKVRVGDKVMAFDEATKQLKPDKVKKVFRHQASEYLIVNKDIRVTESHPVYSNGKWVEIGSLNVGDSLLRSDGQKVAITSITRVSHKSKVYNLEVNPYHTYVADGIVVHNKLAPPKAVY